MNLSSERSMKVASSLVIAALLSLNCCAKADEPIDFVRDVRPIFDKHCINCHGPAKQRSGFRLDVKSEAIKGGNSYQPAIIPGKAADSPLIHLVTGKNKDLVMPPKGNRLTEKEIKTLSAWINAGAVWPAGADRLKLEDKRNHWSFQPLSTPIVPKPAHQAWPLNDIDRFILVRLEKEGLAPTVAADRVALLRRVTFDLTGLPPTPDQVKAFVNDHRPNAYERVVDELLKSPRYGERWAQHWLDVVRYADTHGYEVNTERPNAWPYRDYVIEAFNHDTPYHQFVKEQLVGDAMGKDAATGFLVTSSVLLPGQIGADEPSKRLARQDALDDIVVNIGQTFLGLSIGCARCHDHKFDPISQRDYYAMQGFVAGVEYEDRPLQTPEAIAARKIIAETNTAIAEIDQQLARLVPLANSGVKRPMVNARMNVERFTPVKVKRLRLTINATNNLEPCIDELEVFDTTGKNVALASVGTKPTASGSTTVADRHELRFVNDGIYGNSRSWMANRITGWIALEFTEEQTIDRVVWSRDREGKFTDRLATNYVIEVSNGDDNWTVLADSSDRKAYDANKVSSQAFSTDGLSKEEKQEATKLLTQRKVLERKVNQSNVALVAFAGLFRKPDVIRLLSRGDPEQAKDEVATAIPELFGKTNLVKDASEQQRRLALAEWIANPKNPLTARVIVNRLWQGHFGTGLVDTPSDFGWNGSKPTHPELLDWLAGELIRSGWSMKHLHRQIVLSATYRQSSRINASAQAKDADDRLLWRFPSRRLEAEAVRDSMLFVSGQLNLQMGGRGFDLFDKRGGLTGFKPLESLTDQYRRRMIYAHRVRRERDGVFGAFDCPDYGQSTARRRESTTPLQALNLFNSSFTLDLAKAFTERIEREAGKDRSDSIRHAYRLALGRDPSAEEITDAGKVVNDYGLPALCRALFNSNEFLFLP
jgi:mono/diheme cytochrome c family protein